MFDIDCTPSGMPDSDVSDVEPDNNYIYGIPRSRVMSTEGVVCAAMVEEGAQGDAIGVQYWKIDCSSSKEPTATRCDDSQCESCDLAPVEALSTSKKRCLPLNSGMAFRRDLDHVLVVCPTASYDWQLGVDFGGSRPVDEDDEYDACSELAIPVRLGGVCLSTILIYGGPALVVVCCCVICLCCRARRRKKRQSGATISAATTKEFVSTREAASVRTNNTYSGVPSNRLATLGDDYDDPPRNSSIDSYSGVPMGDVATLPSDTEDTEDSDSSGADSTAPSSDDAKPAKRKKHRKRGGAFAIDARDLKFGKSPKEIGAGSFGVVYSAKWKGETVAVKVLHGGYLGSGKSGKRARAELMAEVEIMANIQPHTNVLMYRGVSEVNGQLALVVEFCSKVSLLANRCFQSAHSRVHLLTQRPRFGINVVGACTHAGRAC